VNRGKLSSCDHGFCFDCIHKWSETTNTCPICKQRFSNLKRIEPESENNKEESRRAPKRKKEDVVEIPYRNQVPDDHFDPNDWWSSDESGSEDLDFFFMDPAFHVILMIHQLGPLIARHHASIIDLTQDDEEEEEPDQDQDQNDTPFFPFPHRHNPDHNNINNNNQDIEPDEEFRGPPIRRARTSSSTHHRGRTTHTTASRDHHHSHSRNPTPHRQTTERNRVRRHAPYPTRSNRSQNQPRRNSTRPPQRVNNNRRRRSSQRPTDDLP